MLKHLIWGLIPVTLALPAAAQESSCNASLAAFSQLQTGMSYQKAASIIGCAGSEMSRSEMAGYVTVMYGWSGGFGGSMNAMFQNNKLVVKSQFGLK